MCSAQNDQLYHSLYELTTIAYTVYASRDRDSGQNGPAQGVFSTVQGFLAIKLPR